MKKYYLFIALAMVAVMNVSRKNNKKAEASEADAEVVEAAKTVLADDVLATIDEFAKIYTDENNFFDVPKFITSCLSEEEKMIKPDYLLDPASTSELITKSQKVAALAILCLEKSIRTAYGMPGEASAEAIERLCAELNYPLANDDFKDLKASDRIRQFYEICKESGELASFWQFNFVVINELAYLISQNPDIFFRNITEEQFATFYTRYKSCYAAVKEIANYDEEVAAALKALEENRCVSSSEESAKAYGSLANAKRTMTNSKEVYAARRAALLK